jgi:transcription initiation factor TFIIIB Brf1 subunit/transcription initiation factor TFIIB
MVKEKIHIGKSPIVAAAVCLYVVSHICKERKTLAEIAEICNTNEPSIRQVLQQPFFKDLRKFIKPIQQPVNKDILRKFVRELLGKIRIEQEGMSVYRFRQNLRLFFAKELTGLTIWFDQLEEILEELKREGLINLSAGPECYKRKYEAAKEPNCPLCSGRKICINYIIQLRENQLTSTF